MTLVWVLTKTTYSYGHNEAHTKVLGVFLTPEGLLEKVDKIAEANKKYPMVKLGDASWRIGPEDDEGFFGDRPVELHAHESKLH